mgnify:CR=1 FL=1
MVIAMRAHKLVTSHLRLVAQHRVQATAATGLPICEVISEGNVGLMQAIEAVRAGQEGFRLATYAHVVDQSGDPGIHPALVDR